MLSHIFLSSLIKSKDFKGFGNDLYLHNLINELNYLEKEGTQIVTKEGEFRVYFVLGLVLGDNLGINTILEFSLSFSSNYICRFCKAQKLVSHNMFVENSNLMHTIENYSFDVNAIKFQKNWFILILF